MKNEVETKQRAQFLFSKRGKGELTGKEYEELRLILNDFVRESRRKSCDFIPEHERPEVFLLELFKSKIFYTVFDFIKNFGLLNQAKQEQGEKEKSEKRVVNLEETSVFREWLSTSRIIVYNIILGDATPRKDKFIKSYLKKFDHSENKELFLNNKSLKADRDVLLGQEGTHKKEPEDIYRTPEYLEECRRLSTQFDMDDPWNDLEDVMGDGFLVRDLAAQDVAPQVAREKKEYNPDKISSDLKELQDSKKLADLALEGWKRGEYPQIKTESDCMAWIKSAFTEGLSLEDFQKKIDDFPPERPDLIISIFGKQGERGKLFERLRDFYLLQTDKAKDIITFSVLTEAIENEKDDEDKIVRKSLGEQASCDIPLESLTEEDFRKLLNPKQSKIWDCVCEGKKTQEIAMVLGQSERNIQKHLKNIRKIWDRYMNEK